MKNYKTVSGARAAVKRQGLHLMEYEITPLVGGGFVPFFYVSNKEDYDEIWERGFQAEINTERAVQ